mmetsp:Transcript_17671/g.33543  ORF Transcript_17671/g.33543 Transcript_17671/m.33543 type:complete len:92 (+) Transcript_17671:260-535(+)
MTQCYLYRQSIGWYMAGYSIGPPCWPLQGVASSDITSKIGSRERDDPTTHSASKYYQKGTPRMRWSEGPLMSPLVAHSIIYIGLREPSSRY